MKNSIGFVVVILLHIALGDISADEAGTGAVDPPPEIDATADKLEYSNQTNILSAIGNVRILYRDVVIEADEVSINTQSQDFTAKDHVTLNQENYTWEGDAVSGNLERKTFEFGRYQTIIDPWFVTGSSAIKNVVGNIAGSDISASTCSYLFENHPHWRLQCSRIVYFPTGRFKAFNVFYKVFNIPIFYFPVIWGKTSRHSGQIHVSTGFDDDSGVIVDIAKDWEFKNLVKSQTGVVYRTKRGFSVRNRSIATTEHSQTDFLAYGMWDKEPLSDHKVAGKEFNGRFESESDRFRFKFDHHMRLNKNLTLTANVDHVSDNLFLFEFFRKEFNHNPQPPSFAELKFATENFELSLGYRPRLNDFESVVERQPELRLEVPRLLLGKMKLYLQSEATAAQLTMNWREHDLPRMGLLSEAQDYFTERLDTANFLFYPFNLKMFNISPRAGARLTYYTRSSKKKINTEQLNSNFLADDPRPTVDNPNEVFNYDDDGGDRLRLALEFGMELSVKSSRAWPNVQSQEWKTDGLRHIVQPFVNYTYIPTPNVDKDNLFFFDEVDRVDKLHFFRLGTRQQFRTQRDGRVYTLFRMENFLDVYISPEDRRDHAGDFGTTLELNPNKAVSFWAKILLDTNKGDVNIINSGASIGKKDKFHMDFTYLYRQSFTSRFNYSMGSEITQILTNSFMPINFDRNHGLHLNFHIPISAKSTFSASYFFDLDQGEVGRQTYEFTRDLHCWLGTLRFEEDADDISVLLIFSLKAFPKLKLDVGV